MVQFQNDFYGYEIGLDLIDNPFSIIRHVSNIGQCGDKLIGIKQWTSAN